MWFFIVALLGAPPPPAAHKPLKLLPTLAREPTIDGDLADLPALSFTMPQSAVGASAAVRARGAFRHPQVYFGISVDDDVVSDQDQLDLTLYFPDSGTTSRGFTYRLGPTGVASGDDPSAPPEWALSSLRAGAKRTKTGFTLEVAIPARALPRFRAHGALSLSVCIDYHDADGRAEAELVASCTSQEMPGGPVRVPDQLRKAVPTPLPLPPEVQGVEGRPSGWVGFAQRHFPAWALGDQDLTPESLATLIAAGSALDPASVALPIPRQLRLPDNRPIYSVLTGRNPYTPTACVPANELRMGMYVVNGKEARQVLDWPAASCSLGRAMRFELSPDGALQIGYTNGSTAHFVWSTDHFERAELGLWVPR